MDRYDDAFREGLRYGSAAWADESDLRRAGLFGKRGPQIGYWRHRPIRIDGDAPMILFGGAGSGKMRDILAYVLCNSPGQRTLVLDPRGEGAAISLNIHAPHGDDAYCWNPTRFPFLPHNQCDPLDILKPGRPTFHADVKFVAEALIAISGSSKEGYFEKRGRDWIGALMVDEAEAKGGVSLPALKRAVDSIDSDSNVWADRLKRMLASPHDYVRRTAGEMLTKQQDSPREFGATMGTIYGALGFLDDPALVASLENPDFSLSALTDPQRPAKVFLNVPAEYLSMWAPLIRLFFTVTMLYKSRAPSAPRVMLLVDEAGQLGRFETLLRAFTFGRGGGIRAYAVFQDIGQVDRNYGSAARPGFIGSAQTRQFFGVRDYETAQLVSNMLGTETLEYDDALRQEQARRHKEAAFRSIFTDDADPFEAARDYAHYAREQANRTKQSRRLMTPEEVMALPEDRQILFISGKDLNPILAWKYPYYTRREMAGLYLNNPYHPPMDRVPVRGWFGTRWRDIVTGPVPERYAGFPQHRDGMRRYVKGYEL